MIVVVNSMPTRVRWCLLYFRVFSVICARFCFKFIPLPYISSLSHTLFRWDSLSVSFCPFLPLSVLFCLCLSRSASVYLLLSLSPFSLYLHCIQCTQWLTSYRRMCLSHRLRRTARSRKPSVACAIFKFKSSDYTWTRYIRRTTHVFRQ